MTLRQEIPVAWGIEHLPNNMFPHNVCFLLLVGPASLQKTNGVREFKGGRWAKQFKVLYINIVGVAGTVGIVTCSGLRTS